MHSLGRVHTSFKYYSVFGEIDKFVQVKKRFSVFLSAHTYREFNAPSSSNRSMLNIAIAALR